MISGLGFFLVVSMTCLSWILARRQSPFVILWQALRRFLFEASYRGPILALVALLALDMLESRFDAALTVWLGYDLTGVIHRLEGDWAAQLQRLAWFPAICFFTFFYIVMFPVILVAPLFLAAAADDLRSVRMLTVAGVINYVVCFPFYFFFPVREMWSGSPDMVRLLVDQLSPAILQAYRTTSALDNCFPSFHTSLSLTVALLAGRLGPRPFAVAIRVTAGVILASTLYLGIHWACDVAAGAALALLASRMARTWCRARPVTCVRQKCGLSRLIGNVPWFRQQEQERRSSNQPKPG